MKTRLFDSCFRVSDINSCRGMVGVYSSSPLKRLSVKRLPVVLGLCRGSLAPWSGGWAGVSGCGLLGETEAELPVVDWKGVGCCDGCVWWRVVSPGVVVSGCVVGG